MNELPAKITALPAEAPQRGRFRFSLITLMLFAAVICLGVSHFRTSLLLYQANEELERYHWEAGHLHLTDESQIHAVGVETHRELVWQWRVFLPEGHDFQWHSQVNSIVRGNIPEKSHPKLKLRGGETYLLAAAIYRDPLGEWKLKLTVAPPSQGSSARTIDLTTAQVAWIGNNSGHGEAGVRPGSGGTSTFAVDEPALLLRYAVHEQLPGGSSMSADGESKGVMFWLEKSSVQ